MKLFTMGKLQVIVLLSVVMGITVSDAKYRSHQVGNLCFLSRIYSVVSKVVM